MGKSRGRARLDLMLPESMKVEESSLAKREKKAAKDWKKVLRSSEEKEEERKR